MATKEPNPEVQKEANTIDLPSQVIADLDAGNRETITSRIRPSMISLG